MLLGDKMPRKLVFASRFVLIFELNAKFKIKFNYIARSKARRTGSGVCDADPEVSGPPAAPETQTNYDGMMMFSKFLAYIINSLNKTSS